MLADLIPFQRMIIRISSEKGVFCGVGWLLSSSQAVTCAHVVTKALGGKQLVSAIPSGKVQINRPFAEDSTRSVTAQVKAWFPKSEEKLSDMALLELDEPLTETIWVKLSHAVTLNGVRCWAWCGIEGHERNLVPIKGIIMASIANDRYVLSTKDSNYKIEKGCSGAPVVDVETGQVLGLIAQKELDKDNPAGFLIPATHWRQTGWFPEPNAGAAFLEPLKTWLNSRFKLCPLERQEIESFVDHYTGTDKNPMPFAGRSEELRYLDNWLAQNQGRLLLLSGSAGRGKSALLLHWLARIISQQPTLTLLFLPISIRFETSNELTGLCLLHAVLCDYFADLRFSLDCKPDTNDYREKLLMGWDRIANRLDQQYLLAIDGIDESANIDNFKNHWLRKALPRKPSANLHVLLSARHRPGETDGKSWFQKLEINGELLELPLLAQSAVTEAIIQLGRPLDEFAERETFVKELYHLTDKGDPLLLNLWIEQIWQYRETVPKLKLKPSLAGFYEKWLEDQETIWKSQSTNNVNSSCVNPLMQVLASAYGPLLFNELVSLKEQVRQLQEETADIWLSWEPVKLRKILTTSSRLVIGDGEKKGFSLVHPRLNDYFQTELANKPAYQRQVHEAYLNWGSEVVARLNQNKLMPDSCPRYLLEHYTEHIVAAPITVAHLKPRDVLEKYWLPLLEGGWHQAWEAYEGTWNSFLSDLERVLEVLRRYNQACYERGERRAMKLAMEVRCALIRASIHTLSQDLPTTLVAQLVQAGIWSLPKTERFIAQFKDRKLVDYLVELAKIVLPENQERLLQQAITVAENIQDEERRANALITLSSLLAGKPHLLPLALTMAENIQMTTKNIQTTAGKIQNEGYCAKVLITLSSLLIGKPHLLQQALTMAKNIQYEGPRVRALIALAPQLAIESHLLQQTLTAAWKIRDEEYRIQVLIALASQLPDKPRQQVLQPALTTLTITENPLSILINWLKHYLQPALTTLTITEKSQHEKYRTQDRAQALILLVSQLVGKPRRQALRQALITVGKVRDEESRAKILTALISQFAGKPPRRILKQALIAAENIQDEWSYTKILITLVSHLVGKPRQRVLKQALIAAKNIPDERYRTEALAALVPHLADEPRQLVLRQALTDVENMKRIVSMF